MSTNIKTPEEIEYMRHSAKILAKTLEETSKIAKAGMSTLELDEFAEKFIRANGGIPAFKGFNGFKHTLCLAVNEEIVHGIPKKNKILKDGDLLTIDGGVIYKGMYSDAARSIGIGKIDEQKTRLIKTAYHALYSALDIIKPGLHLNEIGKLIQKIVEKEGFNIVKELTGHGIGRKLHESPTVINYWDGNSGPTLKEGMCLAIEPIFAAGSGKMKCLSDGWTLVTVDGSAAVQVENTILITQNGCEILTE
ncbi:MAG: type I methionyl aminopeptidase [Patescibacteria group bacterium]